MLHGKIDYHNGKDYDKHVRKIEIDINTSINKITNETPLELWYAYITPLADGNIIILSLEYETKSCLKNWEWKEFRTVIEQDI